MQCWECRRRRQTYGHYDVYREHLSQLKRDFFLMYTTNSVEPVKNCSGRKGRYNSVINLSTSTYRDF